MAARGRTVFLRLSGGLLAAGALTFASLTPASAGIFERIFGGFHRAVSTGLPTNLSAFADPFVGAPREQPRGETSWASANCVRTSDGFHFPVQAHAGVSAAQACRALCPAGETKLYSGGTIDNAIAGDGSRYADLDTAFLYRKELVAGVTCNGRNAFGLARIDVTTDPTLRPGDIVATKDGMVAFTGMINKVADFTPLDNYRAVPKSTRDKLSDVKIMPPNPGAPNVTPVTMTSTARPRDENRSAQLSR
ncbi:MAG TPA: DUF2865 domain-containing protein [Pseudolabrys sp.]|jgi:hypothetical protein